MKKCIETLLVMVSLSYAAQASLVADSFESYSLQTDWSAGINGWTVYNNVDTQHVSIVAANSAFSTGTQALQFYDAASGINEVKLRNTLPETISESMTITFDFNAVAALSGNPTLILNQGATIGVQMLLFDQTTHTMRFNNGAGLADVSAYVLDENLWYRIEITIADMSTGTDTFNIRVWEEDGGSGALVINETGLNFRNNVTGISSIDFGGYIGTNSSRVRFMLDNISVAVPEPATVGLLSVGCLSAFAFRRVSFR